MVFLLLLVIIPSVSAQCLNSQGWVDLAKNHLEKEFKKNGIERQATDAEIKSLLARSVSKIGRTDQLKTNSYLEGKSKGEIGEILSKMNDQKSFDALKSNVENLAPKSNFEKVTGKEFESVLYGESFGGNAGPGRSAVNFLIDKSGNIVAIGNFQNFAPGVRSKRTSGEYLDAGFRIKVLKSEGKNYEVYYDKSLTPKQKEVMKSLETELNLRGKDYSRLMQEGVVEQIKPAPKIAEPKIKVSESKINDLFSSRSEYLTAENRFKFTKAVQKPISGLETSRILELSKEGGREISIYRGLSINPRDVPKFLSNLERNGLTSLAFNKGKSIKDLSPKQLEQLLAGQSGGASEYIQSFTSEVGVANYFATSRIEGRIGGGLPVVIEINTGGLKKNLDARHFSKKVQDGYEREILLKADTVPFENIRSIEIMGEKVYEKSIPQKEVLRKPVKEFTPKEIEQARQKLESEEVLLVKKNREVAQLKVESAKKVAAFSDQHGEAGRLQEMISEGQKRGVEHNVFIGDYMDRGPSGLKVLDIVAKLQSEGKGTMVLGNHDLMFLKAMEGNIEAINLWNRNGGDAVLKEAGIKASMGQLKQNPRLLQENPMLKKAADLMRQKGELYFIENGNLYIHGGIPIDKLGNPFMEYKGKAYRGKDVFKGLDLMKRDIANGETSLEMALGEGGISNPFWIRNFGNGNLPTEVVDNALGQLGLNRVIVGHTPLPIGGQLNKYKGKVINVDGGLANNYGGEGGMLLLDNSGGKYYHRSRKELDSLSGVEARRAKENVQGEVGVLEAELPVIRENIQKQKDIIEQKQPEPAPVKKIFFIPKVPPPAKIKDAATQIREAKTLGELRIVLNNVESLINSRGRTYQKRDIQGFMEHIAKIERKIESGERTIVIESQDLQYITNAGNVRTRVIEMLFLRGIIVAKPIY